MIFDGRVFHTNAQDPFRLPSFIHAGLKLIFQGSTEFSELCLSAGKGDERTGLVFGSSLLSQVHLMHAWAPAYVYYSPYICQKPEAVQKNLLP